MKTTKRKTIPYQEGDWFAVPLHGNRYAIGLAARVSRGSIIAGYFFAPRYTVLPDLEDIGRRNAEMPILISLFSGLGFIEGGWIVIHRPDGWNRDLWPLPPFVHFDPVNPSLVYKRQYNEDSLAELAHEEVITRSEALQYFDDGLSGYVALQIRLERLLPARTL